MGDETKLPELPEEQQMFAGYPRYEAILARECPYIGEPCIRERCKKWNEIHMNLPNPLAPTHVQTHIMHQCQDDGIYMAAVSTANILGQQMMMAQMRAAQQLGQNPRQFPGLGRG
jgi:hypothetical protein